MNQVGSGGIGAVSAGVAESLVWLLLVVAAALVLFGLWKLIKILAVMIG